MAVAEERYLGGTCVNVGLRAEETVRLRRPLREDLEDARGFGWRSGPAAFDWPTLRDNKSREIERLNGVYRDLLEGAGVAILESRATLVGQHDIRVAGRTISAANILICTGSWPFVPSLPGGDLAITSNEAFYLPAFPRRALVVGGGYIAVEFAGIFAGLGAQTSLSYRGELFLRGFDEGIRRFVRAEMTAKGIDMLPPSQPQSIERANGALRCRMNDGSSVATDLVLFATGRRPASQGLGLATAGVTLARNGAIPVDDCYRTNVPHIYAIGDVIDRVQLTPVAIAEGMCVAHNLFGSGGQSRRINYENIATAIFCQPNIGTVGPTEEIARQRYARLEVYESSFKPMKHTLSGRSERTLMKLLVNGDDDKVVAAHMCGPDAGEIVQGLSVAINAGATKADFDATIGIHPTAAEEFVTMREVAR